MNTDRLYMKDIIYTPYNRVAIVEDIIFNNLIDAYRRNKNACISQLWFYSNILTDDDDVDSIDNSFNYNLSIIKKYCPNTYNTFIFTPLLDDNDEIEYRLDIHRDLLFQCGYVLERLFSIRFYTYINSLDGDELSGDDTNSAYSSDSDNDDDDDDDDDDESDNESESDNDDDD